VRVVATRERPVVPATDEHAVDTRRTDPGDHVADE
jgi:hypothetical protein